MFDHFEVDSKPKAESLSTNDSNALKMEVHNVLEIKGKYLFNILE